MKKEVQAQKAQLAGRLRELWYEAGLAEGRKDGTKALLLWHEIIKLAPEEADGHIRCGELLERLKRYSGAAQMYHVAVEREPGNVAAWVALGNALDLDDRGEEALGAYREAISGSSD